MIQRRSCAAGGHGRAFAYGSIIIQMFEPDPGRSAAFVYRSSIVLVFERDTADHPRIAYCSIVRATAGVPVPPTFIDAV